MANRHSLLRKQSDLKQKIRLLVNRTVLWKSLDYIFAFENGEYSQDKSVYRFYHLILALKDIIWIRAYFFGQFPICVCSSNFIAKEWLKSLHKKSFFRFSILAIHRITLSLQFNLFSFVLVNTLLFLLHLGKKSFLLYALGRSLLGTNRIDFGILEKSFSDRCL